ncbi:MAG: hypothetical protein HFK10_08205 [Clostridia bacterium]|nr:hypothetical protein [Clostridia bacterium]
MDMLYHITADFPAVFSINGVFFEDAGEIEYTADGVLYVTVFPLDAVYNPYTVKLSGGRVYANEKQTVVYRLPDAHVYVRMKPRYNYVYAAKETPQEARSLSERFFRAVTSGNVKAARAMLTAELSASVTDAALSGFFDGFTDLVENGGNVYLIDADGNGSRYEFRLRSGLIDDINEL